MRGWVYVIRNKAIIGLVKIGFTTKDPILRAKEFNGTGVPFDFEVVFDALVDSPRDVEQSVHKSLAVYREGKEWFRCEVEVAVNQIRNNAQHIYQEKFHKTDQGGASFVVSKSSQTNNSIETSQATAQDELIEIGSIKAKAMLRLVKNYADETAESDIRDADKRLLKFVSLQLADLERKSVTNFQELGSIYDDMNKVRYSLDPFEQEYSWTLISTAIEICDEIFLDNFEITQRVQSFMDSCDEIRSRNDSETDQTNECDDDDEELKDEIIKDKPIQTDQPKVLRLPMQESICPSCNHVFQPNAVIEINEYWMRCPKCRQVTNII
jgi:hypothetical protein